MNKNTKAQGTIIGLFGVFFSLVLLGALMPTIVTTIANITPILDTSTAIILGLVPLALVLSLVASIFFFTQPQYRG